MTPSVPVVYSIYKISGPEYKPELVISLPEGHIGLDIAAFNANIAAITYKENPEDVHGNLTAVMDNVLLPLAKSADLVDIDVNGWIYVYVDNDPENNNLPTKYVSTKTGSP